MSKWLLYLLLAPLMTPSERKEVKAHYRAQRSAFCQKYLAREMTPEEEKLDEELRKKEGRE